MAKHFPLQPLLEYSQHRMDLAERTLLLLRRRVDQEKQRLEELRNYRREYEQRLEGSARQGITIHLWRDFHVFLTRIGQAIEQQEQTVAQAEARWNQAHEHWLSQRRKVKAYETLAQRHHQAERQRQDKRDQRVLDEQAQKQFLYRSDDKDG